MKSAGGSARSRAVEAIVAAMFMLGCVSGAAGEARPDLTQWVAPWLQTTAPIGRGDRRGPLVNAGGEVVEISTGVRASGQSMDLALSAERISQPCATAKKASQPRSKPPPSRPEREDHLKGDPQKTLALWMQITELRVKHRKSWSVWEKGFQQVPPRDPHNPSKGWTDRLQKISLIYAELAGINERYAGDVKALETKGADRELVVLITVVADFAKRTSDACKRFSAALASHSDDEAAEAEISLKKLIKARGEIGTTFDLLRVKLSRKYDLHFPTLEAMRKKAS